MFFFYGREKEVENLLQILQKDKLVTLIGSSGSGKSSLINAGLIPRLEKGFLAQAGNQWAICKFRPGISPIENLAYSLTSEGSLSIEGKANTEDFSQYLKTIKDLYTPDNIWILENGRPESWGPSPFPVDSRRE